MTEVASIEEVRRRKAEETQELEDAEIARAMKLLFGDDNFAALALGGELLGLSDEELLAKLAKLSHEQIQGRLKRMRSAQVRATTIYRSITQGLYRVERLLGDPAAAVTYYHTDASGAPKLLTSDELEHAATVYRK